MHSEGRGLPSPPRWQQNRMSERRSIGFCTGRPQKRMANETAGTLSRPPEDSPRATKRGPVREGRRGVWTDVPTGTYRGTCVAPCCRPRPSTLLRSPIGRRSVRCYGSWAATQGRCRCGVPCVWCRLSSCGPGSCAGPSGHRAVAGSGQPILDLVSRIRCARQGRIPRWAPKSLQAERASVGSQALRSVRAGPSRAPCRAP